MPSKADIEGWFKALEQTLKEKRIIQIEHFNNEIIKKVERHSNDMYFFFESGKWAKVVPYQDGYGDMSLYLNGDISIHYDVSYFLSGDIVTKHTVETASKYYQELNRLAYEEKDRKEWERLQRKFGKNE